MRHARLRFLTCSASLVVTFLPAGLNAESNPLSVDCIDSDGQVARAPTESMARWLSSYASAYDRDDAFTINATGAMNRVFGPSGMLVHPLQMAALVRGSSSFTGDKAKLVELGVSGTSGSESESYASRLSAALDIEVSGCDGIAYYVNSGLYFCANGPKEIDEVASRLLPIGFQHKDFAMFMAFCVGNGESPDPRTLLSSQAAYGLFSDELVELERTAKTNAEAAFRLYQYYWIAKQDRVQALFWLENSAKLGFQLAQYNFAYELMESGTSAEAERAISLIEAIASSGAQLPDLKQFYPNSGELNE